jgi:hypothetical protein
LAILPNAERAITKSEKLQNYILSSEHSIGRSKATFFRKIGYLPSNWEAFKKDLKKLIQSQDAVESETFKFGIKYTVKGPLNSPSGETIQVLTVWVILKGEEFPRFVTAYSGGKK